jgi:hypothetical protein
MSALGVRWCTDLPLVPDRRSADASEVPHGRRPNVAIQNCAWRCEFLDERRRVDNDVAHLLGAKAAMFEQLEDPGTERATLDDWGRLMGTRRASREQIRIISGEVAYTLVMPLAASVRPLAFAAMPRKLGFHVGT